jgi:4-hydroxy-tetrahydrodipicolinate synthase
MKGDLSRLKNCFTALLSPMDEDDDLCKQTYREFIRLQIKAGCGLVPCGTTGESATMSHQEHESVIRWCLEEAAASGNKPFVLAGAGSNSTKEALSLALHAERMGVDGILVISPYYNKPTQKGLIAHYSELAKAVDIPIVIYNCPGRTGGNILPDTVAELANKFENIRGYKAAEGKIEQISQVIQKCPKDFVVMSGDDGLTYDIMKAGGKGVISVASNVIPERMQKYCELITAGKWEEAKKEDDALQDLFKVLFVETNPGPAKYAAELLGLLSRRVRLPLVPPEPESQEKIKQVLVKMGLALNPYKGNSNSNKC